MMKDNLSEYMPLVEKVADEYQNQGLCLLSTFEDVLIPVFQICL